MNVIIQNILDVLMHSVFPLIQTVAGILGFTILIVGIIRLTKHGKTQQLFRYYAPSTTAMMVFSGSVLVSITGFYEMLSATLFSTALMSPVDTIDAYAASLATDDLSSGQLYLTYALIIVVGFISLIRGMYLLTKISEGGDGHLSRTVSHIVAGIFAMNITVIFAVLEWLNTVFLN